MKRKKHWILVQEKDKCRVYKQISFLKNQVANAKVELWIASKDFNFHQYMQCSHMKSKVYSVVQVACLWSTQHCKCLVVNICSGYESDKKIISFHLIKIMQHLKPLNSCLVFLWFSKSLLWKNIFFYYRSIQLQILKWNLLVHL